MIPDNIETISEGGVFDIAFCGKYRFKNFEISARSSTGEKGRVIVESVNTAVPFISLADDVITINYLCIADDKDMDGLIKELNDASELRKLIPQIKEHVYQKSLELK